MTPQEIEKVKIQARKYLQRKAERKAETPLQRDRRIWQLKLKTAEENVLLFLHPSRIHL